MEYFFHVSHCCYLQIEDDAYQDDLGFSVGQLGKGGVSGPIRGPTAIDKKTQISISKRLQVVSFYTYGNIFCYQRQIQKNQVYGGRSTVQGATTSGTASTIAFTPLQVRWSLKCIARYNNMNMYTYLQL